MPQEILKDSFQMIRLNDIYPSHTNPRKTFDKDELDELADSIKIHGVLQPIIVRKGGCRIDSTLNSSDVPVYEIVSGERRYRACKLAQLGKIPAIVRELDDDAVLEIQIIENLQRKEISPLDEAEGFQRLIDSQRYSFESLAEKIGKRASYVHQRIKLSSLVFSAKKHLRDGSLNIGKALLLARLDPDIQAEVIKNNSYLSFSISEFKKHLEEAYLLRLSEAKFDINDKQLVPAAGDCLSCEHCSGNTPSLFPEAEENDLCQNQLCYEEKLQAHIEKRLDEAEANGYPLVKINSNYNLNIEGTIYSWQVHQLEPKNYEGDGEPPTRTAIIINGTEKGTEFTLIDPDWKPDSDETEEEEKPDDLTPLELLEGENNQIIISRSQKLIATLQNEIVNKGKKLTDLDLKHLAEMMLDYTDEEELFERFDFLNEDDHKDENGETEIHLSKLKKLDIVKIILYVQVDDCNFRDTLESKALAHGIKVEEIKTEIEEELPLKTLEDIDKAE